MYRHLIGCPVCFRSMGDPGDDPETMVRIVAFRAHAIRFECPRCGVRFSVDRTTFAAACDGRGRGLMSDHGWRQTTVQHIWHRDY